MPAPRPPVVRIDGDDVRLSRSRYPLHGLERRNGQQPVKMPELSLAVQVIQCVGQCEAVPLQGVQHKLLKHVRAESYNRNRTAVRTRGCGSRSWTSPCTRIPRRFAPHRAPAGGETTGCADQIQNAAQKSPSALPADGGSCQRTGTGSRPPGVVVFLHGLPSVCVKRNHGFSFLRIQIVLRIVPCRSDRCACGEAQEPPVFVKRSQCNPVYPVSPPGFSAEAAYITIREFYLTSHAASSVSRIGLQNPSPVNCLSAPRSSMKTCSPRWKSTALPI